MNVIATEQQFYEEVRKESISVLKFISSGCTDSAILNRFIGDIAEEFQEMAWFEIDRDELILLAEKYEVYQTPSLLVVRKGDKIAQIYSESTKVAEDVRKFLNAIRKHYLSREE